MTSNELAALPNGTVLVLNREVANPQVDRRERHDWRKEEFIKKGFKLLVIKREQGSEYEPAHIELRPVSNRWAHQDLYLNVRGEAGERGTYCKLTTVIVANLESTGQDYLSSYQTLCRFHWCDQDAFAGGIVEELLKSGKLTLAEAEALYKANLKRPENQ